MYIQTLRKLFHPLASIFVPLCCCTTSKQLCMTSLFIVVNSTFNVAISRKMCPLLLLKIIPSFSCMNPLLLWKSCPFSSCTNLHLSLGECALLLLLLSLLHELNLFLEKSDSSPSCSSSPQSASFMHFSMCNSFNTLSPNEIDGKDLIFPS